MIAARWLVPVRALALAIAALPIAALAWPALAHAEVQRYALIVGNDVGAAGDERLRYAESDAAKVQGVLTSIGDFAHGCYLLAELAGQLYVFERQRTGEPDTELGATFSVRPMLGAGKHF